MPVSCEPSDLLEGAKCFDACLGWEDLSAIELWLLTQIAETTTDVATLLENSKCLENCVQYGDAQAIIVWLLSQIAGVSSDPNALMAAGKCIQSCITPEQSKAIDVSLEVQKAEATTDLTVLLRNAKCFRHCVSDWRGTAIKIWLLATEAGVSTNAADLIGNSNCLLGCLNQEQLKLLETWLWCQISQTEPETPPDSFPNLSYWWRADDLSSIGDGNPVGAPGKEWVDRIAGVKGQQANAARRPTYVSSWTAGQPAVRNHVELTAPKYLDLSALIVLPAPPAEFTSIFVVSMTILSGNPNITCLALGRGGGLTAGLGSVKGGAFYQPNIVNDAGVPCPFPAWVGANLWSPPHSLFLSRNNASACFAFYNNTQKVSRPLVGSISLLAMPSVIDFVDDTDLYIAESIVYSSLMSDANLASLYNTYLQPRYSL